MTDSKKRVTCLNCGTGYFEDAHANCPNCTSPHTVEAEEAKRNAEQALQDELDAKLEAAEAERLAALQEDSFDEDAESDELIITPKTKNPLPGCVLIFIVALVLTVWFVNRQIHTYLENKTHVVIMQVASFSSKGVLNFDFESPDGIRPAMVQEERIGKNFAWPVIETPPGYKVINLIQTPFYYLQLDYMGKTYDYVEVDYNLWDELAMGDDVNVVLNSFNEIIEVIGPAK